MWISSDSSFPGSAWERTASEALPRAASRLNVSQEQTEPAAHRVPERCKRDRM